jgi:hypothetical protein
VLVVFVRVDGEDIAMKVFRKAQNDVKCEGREGKTKEVIKTRIIIYLREIFHRKI